MIKLNKIVGYVELYGCIAGGIGLIYLAFTGTDHPMIILRGLIIIPFGIWWGLRTIRKARKEEDQKKLQRNLEIILEGFELTRKE